MLILLTASKAHADGICVAPPSNLVSWWPSDGNANDIVDNNHGTPQGGTSFAAGLVNQAFIFSGGNGYVVMPSKPVSSLIASTFTIEFWANPGATADRPTFGFTGSGQSNAANPIASYDGWLTIGDGSNYQLLQALPVAAANNWTHYAIVDDGSNYRVYVNGSQQYSAAITTNPASGSNRQFVIGQSGFSSPYDNFYNGKIDEFSIYSRALNTTEIQSVYNAGSSGKCKPDADNDTVTDAIDNCPFVQNTDQANSDSIQLGKYPNYPGWSDNRTSVCGQGVMGGYNIFGAGASTSKTFNLSAGTHTLNFTFVKIDSWDGEYARAFINNVQVWSKQYVFPSGTQICGAGSNWYEIIDPISVQLNHAGGPLAIRFDSTLDQAPNDESWGVDDIRIVGDTFGDACDTCPTIDNQDQNASACADSDNDTVFDNIDRCPGTSPSDTSAFENATGCKQSQVDSDLNGICNQGINFETSLCVPACVAAPSNLVSWWPAEGTANDIIDANHGTLKNGATATASGIVGQAFSFDGADDFVDTGTYFPGLTNNFSFVLWVKPGATQVTYADIFGNHGEPFRGIVMQQDTSNTNLFTWGYGTGSAWAGTTAGVQLTANVWQHVAAVKDSNYCYFYLNGVERARASCIAPVVPNPSLNFMIARGYASDRAFNGFIDEFAIFNRSLNASEIQSIYFASSGGICKSDADNDTVYDYADRCPNTDPQDNSTFELATGCKQSQVDSDLDGICNLSVNFTTTLCTPACAAPPSNIISWWPGDGNANDIWDANHGILQNGAGFAAGKVGQAFSFDGVDDYVNIPDNDNWYFGTRNFSIGFWVKFTSVSTQNQDMMGQSDGGGIQNKWFISYNFQPTPNSLTFDVARTGGAEYRISTAWTPLANTWYYIVITRDYDKWQWYVNGEMLGPTIINNLGGSNSVPNSVSTLKIGVDGELWRYFNGAIDEVEIYNHTLASSEIQAIYNASSAGKCKPDDDNDTVYNFIDKCPATEQGDPTIFERATGCKQSQVDSDLDGFCNHGLTFATTLCTPVCAVVSSNLISWWPGDGNANDIIDNNHGTLQGTTFATGLVNQSFSFDGADDYVLVPNSASLSPASQVTVEAWVFPTAFRDPYSNVVVIKTIPGSWYEDYGIGYYGSVNQKFYFRLNNNAQTIFSTSSVVLNQWTHIAATYDGSAMKIYVNGQLENSLAYSASLATSGGPLRLGLTGINTHGMQGRIDEPSIYNRALSDTEIQQIFFAGSTGKCRTTLPPSVTILTPNSTSSFDLNATIIWTINDPDSSSFNSNIFYNNGTHTIFIDSTSGTTLFWDTSLLTEGFYTIRINVTDGINNVSAVSAQFKIDHTAPSVALVNPADNALTNANPIQFSFIATDNLDAVLSCSVLIDNIVASSVQANNGSTTISSISDIAEGQHEWFVRCIDAANHVTDSATRTITAERTPPVIHNVEFTEAFTAEMVEITANVSDSTAVAVVQALVPAIAGNRTIILTYNPVTTLFNGTFTASLISGNYSVFVNATDTAGNIAETNVVLEIKQGVDLSVSGDDISVPEAFTGDVITVTAIVRNTGGRNANNVQITLSADGRNITSVFTNVSANSNATAILIWGTTGFAGNVTIAVRAVHTLDSNTANNIGQKTIFIDGHDFAVSLINFVPQEPVFSGETVTINASILNRKDIEAQNIRVNFYEGLTDLDHLIEFKNIPVLSANELVNVTAQWNTAGLLFNRTIIVEVNPQNIPAETERRNNILSASFYLERFVPEQIPDYLTFTQKPLTSEQEAVRGMTSNDFTGDGKTDFAVLTSAGRLILYQNNNVIYLNDTKVKSVNFTKIELAQLGEPAQGLASADFSFDGYPDIVVGTASGKVILFDNVNGIFSPIDLFDAGNDVFGLTIGDIDNDNDFDIITGNKIGHVDFYVNNGANTMNFVFNRTVTTRDQPYGLTTGDFDLDSHTDFMVGDRLGQLERIVFEIDRYNGFLFADIGEFAHGLTTADIDYNGKLDLFALGFNGDINLYYSRAGGLVAEPLIVGNKRDSLGLTSGDYDRDNDIDLIVGSENGDIALFENSVRMSKSFSPMPVPPRRSFSVFTDMRNPYARDMINLTLEEKWNQDTAFVNDFFVLSGTQKADVHFFETPRDNDQTLYHFYLNFPSQAFVRACPRQGGQCGVSQISYNNSGALTSDSFLIPDLISLFELESLFLKEGFKMEYALNATSGATPVSAITNITYAMLGSFATPATSFLLSDDVSNINNQLANAKNINPLPFKNEVVSADQEVRMPDFSPVDITFTTPQPVMPGQTLNYYVTIANYNNIAISNVNVLFIAEGNRMLGTHGFNIGPNANTNINGIPFVVSSATPNVTVIVNPYNSDLETDFTNNERTESISTANFTNLAITNITVGKYLYVEGEPITVNVTVKNIGESESFRAFLSVPSILGGSVCGGTLTSLKLSCTAGNDTTLPGGDFCNNGQLAGFNSNVGNLLPGEEITLSFSGRLGDFKVRSQGTYFLSALLGDVGGDGLNIDTDLTNNVIFDPVPITVLPSPVDLQFDYTVPDYYCIGGLHPVTLTPINETAMQISFNTFNNGGEDAGSYDTLIFLDNNDSLPLARLTTPFLQNHSGRTDTLVLDWLDVNPGDHTIDVYLDYGTTSQESTAIARSVQGFEIISRIVGIRGEVFTLTLSTENNQDFTATLTDYQKTYSIARTSLNATISTIGDLYAAINSGGYNTSGAFVNLSGLIEFLPGNASPSQLLSAETLHLYIPGSLQESIEGIRHRNSATLSWKEIVASNLRVNPSFVAPRDMAIISADVSNTGDIASGQFTVKLEIDNEVREERVISLQARASTNLLFNYVVPEESVLEHFIRITADSNNVITGEDETNNIVTGTLPVSADYELNILSREYGNNKLSSMAYQDGNLLQTAYGFEEFFMEYDSSPEPFDYDGDNDLDLIVGSLDGKITSYRNNGTWQETSWDEMENVPAETINYLNQHGTPAAKISQIDVGARSVPRFADLNNDSIAELVVGNAHGKLVVYSRIGIFIPGTGVRYLWNRTDDNLIDMQIKKAVPAFADLDNDGDKDMVVGDASGSLNGFEKIGSGFVAKDWLFGSLTASNAAPSFYDIDSDGDKDLILGGSDQLLLVNNTETGWQVIANFSLAHDIIPQALDIGNDNQMDIIFGSNNFTQLPIRRGYYEPINVQIINYARNEIELNSILLSAVNKTNNVILTNLYQDGPFEKRLLTPTAQGCKPFNYDYGSILSGYRIASESALEKEYKINIPSDLPDSALAVRSDKIENVNPPYFYEYGEGPCGATSYLGGTKGSPVYQFNETLNANTFDIFVEEDMVYEINSPYRVFFNGTLSEEVLCNSGKFCPILGLTPGYLNTIIASGEIIRHTKKTKTSFDIVDPETPALELFIENKFGLELKPTYIEDVIVSLKNNNKRAFDIDRISLELYDKKVPTSSFDAHNITFYIYGNASLVDLYTDTSSFSIQPGEKVIKTYKVYIPAGVPANSSIVARAVEKHEFYDEQYSRNAIDGLVPEPSDHTTFGPVISSDLEAENVYNSSSVEEKIDERILGAYSYPYLVHFCDSCVSQPYSCEYADFNFLKKQFWIPQTTAKAEFNLYMSQVCEQGCTEEASHVTSWINGKNKGTYTTDCNSVQIGWTPIAQDLMFGQNNEFANYNFGPHRTLKYTFYEILAVDFMEDVIVPATPAIVVNVTSFGENNQLRRQFEERVNVTFKNNDDDPRSIDVITFDLIKPDNRVIHLYTSTDPIYFAPEQESKKTFRVLIPSDAPLNSRLRVTAEHIFTFPDKLWLRDHELSTADFLSPEIPDYHFGDTLPTGESSKYRKHFFVPTDITRAELILGAGSSTSAYLNGEFQGRGYPGWSPMSLFAGFRAGANNLMSIEGPIPETETQMYAGSSFIGGYVTDAEEDVFFTVFGVREQNLIQREPFRVFPGEQVTARIRVDNKYNKTMEFNMRLYTVDFITLQEQTITSVPLIVNPFETRNLEVDITIPETATNSRLQLKSIWNELLPDKNWLRGSNFNDAQANNRFFDDSKWGVTKLSPANERAIYYRRHIWVDSLTEKIKLRASGAADLWVNGLDVPEFVNNQFFYLSSSQFTKSDDNLITIKAANFDVDADIQLEHFVPVRSTDLEMFDISISHCPANFCSFNITKADKINVNFTLRNAGELFSKDFVLTAQAYNTDTQGTIELAREKITMHPFSSDNWKMIFDTSELAGNYIIKIKADSDDTIIESSEANNEISMNVYINTQPKIDYADINDLQGFNEISQIKSKIEDSDIDDINMFVTKPNNDIVQLPFTQNDLVESEFSDSIKGEYKLTINAQDALGLTDSLSHDFNIFDSLYLNIKTTKPLYYLGQNVKLTDALDSNYEKVFTNTPPQLSNAYDNADLVKGGERITITTNAFDKDDDLITLYVCSSDQATISGCEENSQLCTSTSHINPACSFLSEQDNKEHQWFAFVFDSEGNEALNNGLSGEYTTDSIPPQTELLTVASSTNGIDDQNDQKTIITVKGNEPIQCKFGKDSQYRFHKDKSYEFLDNNCVSSSDIAICNLGNIRPDDPSIDPITNKTIAHISCIDKAGNQQNNEINLDAFFEVKTTNEVYDNYQGDVIAAGSQITLSSSTPACLVSTCNPVMPVSSLTVNTTGINYLKYRDNDGETRTTSIIVNTIPVIETPVFFDLSGEHAFIVQSKIIDPDSQQITCSINSEAGSVNSIVSDGILTVKVNETNNALLNLTIICNDGIDSSLLSTTHQLPNQPPFLRKFPDISVNPGETMQINLQESAIDPENDDITFSVDSSNIASLSINGSMLSVIGLVSGTEQFCLVLNDLMSQSTDCTNLFVENPSESKIKNNEFTNTTINLLIKVQFFNNQTNTWLDDNFVQLIPVRIQSGSRNQIKLSPIFDQWSTSSSLFTQSEFRSGFFRVIVSALDNNNQTLINRDNSPIEKSSIIFVVNPKFASELSGIPDIFVLENEQPDAIDLWELTLSQNSPQELLYNVVDQTNPALISCGISNVSLSCSQPALNQSGISLVNVSLFDTMFTDYDDLSANIISLLRYKNISLSITCIENQPCEWQTQLGDAGFHVVNVTTILNNVPTSRLVTVLVRPS